MWNRKRRDSMKNEKMEVLETNHHVGFNYSQQVGKDGMMNSKTNNGSCFCFLFLYSFIIQFWLLVTKSFYIQWKRDILSIWQKKKAKIQVTNVWLFWIARQVTSIDWSIDHTILHNNSYDFNSSFSLWSTTTVCRSQSESGVLFSCSV